MTEGKSTWPVPNPRSFSLVATACFVFAPPVLKVQDRIALAVLVVPRRRCQAKKATLRPQHFPREMPANRGKH